MNNTIKRPLIDVENKCNLEPTLYPLFLGKELFVSDSINVTYPKLVDIREKLMSERWRENEFDLSQDSVDIKNPLLTSATDVMRITLQFQHILDTVASHSIKGILGLFCSNPELNILLTEWEMNEDVHALTYSEIIKICFENPNDLLEDTRKSQDILARVSILSDVFEATQDMGYRYKLGMFTDEEAMRRQILKFLAALISLEAISFSASFASTFAIVRGTKAFDGISKYIQLIARDEIGSHVVADIEIMKVLLNIPEWRASYDAIKPEIQVLFDTMHQAEAEWAEYLFSEGRSIIGLNVGLLNKYVSFLCAPIYRLFEMEIKFEVPKEDPLPWMSDYLDMNAIQLAPQEAQLANYTLNNTLNDLDDKTAFEF